MRGWSWLGLMIGLAACQKPGSGGQERAPVTPGGMLLYEVTEASAAGSVIHEVKLSFTEKGEDWEINFEATAPAEGAPPVRVNAELVPADNVISAYSLGRLYLPTAGRAANKRTACGMVGAQRKYKQWDVFPVDGACGTMAGTRFYEASTGMLVGWLYSGAVDEAAVLKDSR